MDLHAYKLFAIVAETGSMSQAAEIAGYTQSGISHAINRMEKELGLKLFTRDRYGVRLTPIGHELLPRIITLITYHEHLEQLLYDIKGVEVGTLNIGTFPSIAIHWLPPIIRQFHRDHPNIHIHLKEGGMDDLYRFIENRQVDFAFYNPPPNHELALEFIPIQKDEFVALFPLEYPLDNALEAYPIMEFENKPFILSEPSIDYDIKQLLDTYQVSPDIRFSSRDDYAIMSMVEHNLGMSILPKLIISQRQEYLKVLSLIPACYRELGICLKSFKEAAPAAKKFIYFTLNYFDLPYDF